MSVSDVLVMLHRGHGAERGQPWPGLCVHENYGGRLAWELTVISRCLADDLYYFAAHQGDWATI